MKKAIKLFLPAVILLVVLLSVTIFYAVTLNRDNNLNITEANLSKNAKITGSAGARYAFDNSKMTYWTVNSPNKEAVVNFEKEEQVNALLLNEVGLNVQKFEVYYLQNDEWKLCYRQNEIGINRLATFYNIKTKALKVVVKDMKNSVRISDIKVYNLQKRTRDKDFRVTGYVTPESLNNYNPETGMAGNVDEDYFDVLTDVQYIAYGRFDAEGNVTTNPTNVNNLPVLKQMIGDRDVNIYITVFPPLGSSMADVYRNHMDNAVKSIVDTVLETDVDGADFDWEYPRGAEEYALYSDFLVRLKKELAKHGKLLSVAASAWGMNLSKEAVQSIDLLQVMAYDLFDHNGDNNSFMGSVESNIQYMLNQGFTLEQINLGISFYGRPSDASGKWFNYNDPKFTPDEYIMHQNGVWFNSPTTVRDKTVYSILRGLGGVMIFAMDEDLPMEHELSMTAQIGKAKQEFFSVGGAK